MRNFIILFREKTGTSPLVRLLDRFDTISIVHQKGNTGFEPFDRHQCGRMTSKDLKKCLDIIFGKEPINLELLNRIYTAKAKRPLDTINEEGAVGFKMRFNPPNPYPAFLESLTGRIKFLERDFRNRYAQSFKKMMFDLLKKHDVIVLIAVRQDVFRLSLSKYHGDGTGNPGHLQFKLARGAITRNEIGKIHVDCDRLEEIISTCELVDEENRVLMEDFKRAGIQTHAVLYEEFVTDKRNYMERLFRILELDISDDELSRVLAQEEYIKKVHSDDISEFVENHEEVTSRFADRYISWR